MQLNSEQKTYLQIKMCRDLAKNIRLDIGKAAANARLEKGWTLEKASNKMFDLYNYSFGVHTLEKIELGKYDLKIWDIILLSQLYNLPFDIKVLTT